MLLFYFPAPPPALEPFLVGSQGGCRDEVSSHCKMPALTEVKLIKVKTPGLAGSRPETSPWRARPCPVTGRRRGRGIRLGRRAESPRYAVAARMRLKGSARPVPPA